jgi:2-keto-3-deoxy-L-rhamnonate aldolase RhmA
MKSRWTGWAAGCALCALFSGGTAAQKPQRHNRIADLLSQNKVVFGWFSTARTLETTPEAAARAAKDPLMDFVFINMEAVRSYNPPLVKTFLETMKDAGLRRSPNDRPLMLRLPIFHNDPAAARQRIAEVLNLGVHALVFPDMESAEEGRDALAAMRFAPAGVRPDDTGEAPGYWNLAPDQYKKKADVYPINPDGELASIFIIESEKGVANSREITKLRPTVAIPGPGTLRSVFKGDMEKVEAAIQTQLASCKEFNVPCGITANATDVAKRIEQGFKMIIIYDRDYAETIAAGRKAAGR